jgi:hypothetical protein
VYLYLGICSRRSNAETVSTDLSARGIFEISVIWTKEKFKSSTPTALGLTSEAIKVLHLNGLLGLAPDPKSRCTETLSAKESGWLTCHFIQLGFQFF